MTFRGWPQDALDFYEGLEADNSKTYFHAHKQMYDECVKAPFLALSDEIEREFGPLHVFRPNRDIRFAKDKTPYKTAAAAVTERSKAAPRTTCRSRARASTSAPATTTSRRRPARALPRRGRRREDRAEARGRGCRRSASRSYEVGTQRLVAARAARLSRTTTRASSCCGMKGMHVGKTFGAPRWLHTAGALDRIVKTWRDAAPVNNWFDKNVGPSTMAPPEPD